MTLGLVSISVASMPASRSLLRSRAKSWTSNRMEPAGGAHFSPHNVYPRAADLELDVPGERLQARSFSEEPGIPLSGFRSIADRYRRDGLLGVDWPLIVQFLPMASSLWRVKKFVRRGLSCTLRPVSADNQGLGRTHCSLPTVFCSVSGRETLRRWRARPGYGRAIGSELTLVFMILKDAHSWQSGHWRYLFVPSLTALKDMSGTHW